MTSLAASVPLGFRHAESCKFGPHSQIRHLFFPTSLGRTAYNIKKGSLLNHHIETSELHSLSRASIVAVVHPDTWLLKLLKSWHGPIRILGGLIPLRYSVCDWVLNLKEAFEGRLCSVNFDTLCIWVDVRLHVRDIPPVKIWNSKLTIPLALRFAAADRPFPQITGSLCHLTPREVDPGILTRNSRYFA